MGKRKLTRSIDTQEDLENLLLLGDTTTIRQGNNLGEKINRIKERIASIEAGSTYISDNLNELRGRFNITPTQAINMLDDLAKNMSAEVKSLKDLRAKRVNLAARQNRARRRSGEATLGFVNTGLGDCTLIKSPQGVNIMIDCGSDSTADVVLNPLQQAAGLDPKTKIAQAISSQGFLNNGTNIDLVFLTHPDKDHYNLIKESLESIGQIKLGFVYYGGAKNDFSKYAAKGTSTFITDSGGTPKPVFYMEQWNPNAKKASVIRTLDGIDISKKQSGQINDLGNEFIDPVSKEMVIYYEKDFRVSILAANVNGVLLSDNTFTTNDTAIKGPNEPKQDGTLQNKGSLVVLIRIKKQTILVMGDATAVTEQFVVDYFSNILQTVNILRIGHHGSPTSSSLNFLNKMSNLQWAIASTGGQRTTKSNLPKAPVMNLYKPNILPPNKTNPHSIYAWNEIGGGQTRIDNITTNLWSTGSNDTIWFT